MSDNSTIRTNGLTAGILSAKADGRGYVFYATDAAFGTLHGSAFANRHAAQRAADRLAQASDLGSFGRVA